MSLLFLEPLGPLELQQGLVFAELIPEDLQLGELLLLGKFRRCVLFSSLDAQGVVSGFLGGEFRAQGVVSRFLVGE